MATTITTQSTTIKRIVHDPARNRVLIISASGVDIYRVTDWTRIAWAAIANATCGAFNNNGIYIGSSTGGVFRLPLSATGAATSQLVQVFGTGAAVELTSYNIADIAGHAGALAIVTSSEFVYLPTPTTSYAGPTTATAVAMNGTYLVWATSGSVEILDTLPTADFSSSDTTIGDTANHIAFEVGTNNLLICHEDGLRLVDCADPGAAGVGLPTDGLQILWTMDAVSGTSLLDDSGKGHNGTISGAIQATGSIGKALDFDGSNDQVSIASHADFNHGADFSISLRFKTSDSTNRQSLFWKNPTGAAGFWCRIEPADNRIRAYVYDGADGCMLATTQHYCDGAEHKMAVVFDGTTFSMTIDGTIVATGDASAVGDWSNTDPFYLGRSSAGADWHAGWIDEFRFYNRSMTTAEITALEDQTDPTVPRAGLVAHYTMDAISGTSLYDETGTQNGTTSGTTQVEGHLGQALSFGGDGDKVTIAKNSAFDFGSAQDFSYAVWFKTPETARGDILENGNQGGKWSTLYINSGIFAGALDDGTNAVWVSGSTNAWTVNDDAWHFGAVTFDRSGNAQRYMDGEAYGDPYSVGSVGDITHATDGITLGTRADHDDHFEGEMDALRIYNRVLSAEEIAALFAETTNPMPRAGLVSHWTMDSIDGTSLIDETGTANGTINGATQVDGYIGKALSFDGTDDFVEIPHNASLKPTAAVSFSAWVYRSDWSSNTGNVRVISCTHTGGWALEFDNTTAGIVEAIVRIDASYVQAAFDYTSLAAGWHFFTGTCDGRYVKIFVDGDLEATVDYGSTSSILYSYSNSLLIGAEAGSGTGAAGNYWPGMIESVRVYNRDLTIEEIGILLLEGVGGVGTNYDDIGTVTDCQDAMKVGDYVAYGTSNGSDGGRFGIMTLDEEGAATSKTTVASTDTEAVWIAEGATEAIYNNQLERYRLVAEMSPGVGARSVRRDWALYAEITDSLGGIQSGTVALKVNGVSKTPTTAAITNGYAVTHTPGGNSGYGERVTIEISGTDADGNTVSRSWAFTTASAPALTVTDAAPPNVTCIRDISLAAAEADETVDSVNVIWIDTITSPLIVTEAQAKEVGRVAIDGQTYHRHKVGVKVLGTDAGALQTRDLRQGSIATITCDALGMSAQKCEILAAQRVIDDGAEDISFNLQAAYYEEV